MFLHTHTHPLGSSIIHTHTHARTRIHAHINWAAALSAAAAARYVVMSRLHVIMCTTVTHKSPSCDFSSSQARTHPHMNTNRSLCLCTHLREGLFCSFNWDNTTPWWTELSINDEIRWLTLQRTLANSFYFFKVLLMRWLPSWRWWLII